jgi:hypothetical protein
LAIIDSHCRQLHHKFPVVLALLQISHHRAMCLMDVVLVRSFIAFNANPAETT